MNNSEIHFMVSFSMKGYSGNKKRYFGYRRQRAFIETIETDLKVTVLSKWLPCYAAV